MKADAFEQLFSPFGIELAKEVRKHHEKNGGISRYEKIPIYLNWASESYQVLILKTMKKNFHF